MLITEMRHIDRQVSMTTHMLKALSFLQRQNTQGLAEGKIEIDGDRVFAIVQRYETIRTEAPKFEYHRKYLDIQFMVSGEEIIGWTSSEQMTIMEPYTADKDICFGTAPEGKWSPVHLQEGQLAVFWPEDGHAPRISVGPPAPVMKIVVKVAM